MQPSGTPSSGDDDAPDGGHECIKPTIHAAQDNGAGAGDDLRHWREPEFDDTLPRRARIPGDHLDMMMILITVTRATGLITL